jgi:hypothetical protein
MTGFTFVPRDAREDLRKRFNLLMAIRPGETEADCLARLTACAALGVANSIAYWREKIVAANAHLMTLNIVQDERIALLRALVHKDYGWLAAEVVHGRPPADHPLIEALRERRDD